MTFVGSERLGFPKEPHGSTQPSFRLLRALVKTSSQLNHECPRTSTSAAMHCSPLGSLLLQTLIHMLLGSYKSLGKVFSPTCPTPLLHCPTLLILSLL